jgi:acetylornithine deacetylase
VQVERRTIPGETEDQAVAELQRIIDKLSTADETFSATVNAFFVRNPFEARPSSNIVRTLSDSAAQVLGYEPSIVGEMPWMDSALLAEAGIDTVVIGPAGAGAHAHEEWVDLESVSTLALILAQTALNYGNQE